MKIFKSIALAAASLMALASCQSQGAYRYEQRGGYANCSGVAYEDVIFGFPEAIMLRGKATIYYAIYDTFDAMFKPEEVRVWNQAQTSEPVSMYDFKAFSDAGKNGYCMMYGVKYVDLKDQA